MPTKIDLSCLQFKSIHAKLMDSMVFFRGSGMALLLCFLLDASAQDTLKVYFRSDSVVPLNAEVLEEVKQMAELLNCWGIPIYRVQRPTTSGYRSGALMRFGPFLIPIRMLGLRARK